MKWSTELPFNFNGVDGDLKIVYNPLNQKFYQNEVEIKRKGLGFGGLKYKVKTTDGGEEIVKIKGALLQGRQAEFRGEIINLEESLSNLSFFLSFLPFIFIPFIVLVFTGGRFGVIDAALLGGCGALGMQAIGNSLRGAKEFRRANNIQPDNICGRYSTILCISTDSGIDFSSHVRSCICNILNTK